MKTGVIILTVCVVSVYTQVLSNEQKTKLRGIKDKCISEIGVNKDVVDSIIKGKSFKRTPQLDCFAACALNSLQIVKPDGSLDVEKALAKSAMTKVDKTKAAAVINACKSLVGKDKCETGGKILSCFIEKKDFTVLQ